MYNTPPTNMSPGFMCTFLHIKPVPWINVYYFISQVGKLAWIRGFSFINCLGVSQIDKIQDFCKSFQALSPQSGLRLCPCSYLCTWKEQHSLRWLPPEMEADFISCTHVSELMYKPATNCLSFLSLGSLICHLSFCGSALRTSPRSLFSLYLHIDLLSRGCFTQRSN